MSMNLKASFVSYLSQKYPVLSENLLQSLISDQLLSPFQVSLTEKQILQLQDEVRKYWQLRQWGATTLHEDYLKKGLRIPANNAVCMSYDFHINKEGSPELIEINTNAAFLGMGLELYRHLDLALPVKKFDEHKLIEMFDQELTFLQKPQRSVAILDQNPEQQRLYAEFILFRALFEKAGIQSGIFDITEFTELPNYSMVYNRYTDFYLEAAASSEIRRLFNENKIDLSPNPYEYFLLADKERLLNWNNQNEVPKPASLLKIYDLGKEERDKVWAQRKHLFFKPKNSYGGKQAYRGGSMSRKVFDENFNSNFIAQQYSAPSEIAVEIEKQPVTFKYDLRCYAYRDELQLIVARLYQGQTTNLKTTGGGFACVTVV